MAFIHSRAAGWNLMALFQAVLLYFRTQQCQCFHSTGRCKLREKPLLKNDQGKSDTSKSYISWICWRYPMVSPTSVTKIPSDLWIWTSRSKLYCIFYFSISIMMTHQKCNIISIIIKHYPGLVHQYYSDNLRFITLHCRHWTLMFLTLQQWQPLCTGTSLWSLIRK